MHMLPTDHPQVSLFELGRQVMRLLRERRDESRRRAHIRHELQTYSDRELADMGLARGDIDDVVMGRYQAV